jgi:hypothetical protein
MAEKKLVLSICLPRRLAEIREEIVCRTVELFGTQKLAAKNLNIAEATVSHMLNKIRRRKPSSGPAGRELKTPTDFPDIWTHRRNRFRAGIGKESGGSQHSLARGEK